jgi:hypothetical protein
MAFFSSLKWGKNRIPDLVPQNCPLNLAQHWQEAGQRE